MASLVGIPYKELDCWGLACKFYELHGHKLPDYLSIRRKEPKKIEDHVKEVAKNYKEVSINELNYGDLILINYLGIASHIAIAIDKKNMLHCTENNYSQIDKISRWQKRIVKVYRWIT